MITIMKTALVMLFIFVATARSQAQNLPTMGAVFVAQQAGVRAMQRANKIPGLAERLSTERFAVTRRSFDTFRHEAMAFIDQLPGSADPVMAIDHLNLLAMRARLAMSMRPDNTLDDMMQLPLAQVLGNPLSEDGFDEGRQLGIPRVTPPPLQGFQAPVGGGSGGGGNGNKNNGGWTQVDSGESFHGVSTHAMAGFNGPSPGKGWSKNGDGWTSPGGFNDDGSAKAHQAQADAHVSKHGYGEAQASASKSGPSKGGKTSSSGSAGNGKKGK